MTDSALAALSGMENTARKLVLDGIRTHLIDNNPSQVNRNKFLLKRPSVHAERELRLNDWRVFYSVENDDLVIVNLIGEKRRNKLLIRGEEFEL